MIGVQRLNSYLNQRNLGYNSNDSGYVKLGKVAAGIGVAGLALVSWKFIVIGGLGYSAFKGTQYLQNRFFSSHNVRQEDGDADGAGAVADGALPQAPIDAGHDAHNDQQQHQEPEDPIAPLREMQAGLRNWHARRAFEAILTHPKILERHNDIHWLGKMVLVHGKWSKRTLGLALPIVQGYRKIKGCFKKVEEAQENPAVVAIQ